MAFQSYLTLSVLLIAFSASARPVPPLAARLQANGTAYCWDSLMELRSCSGEVILFFLNGETYLGPSCCRAIRFIEHKCWAADAMLSVLGFTAEEGDILKGYCDATDEPSAAPPPPSGPPAAPAATKVAVKGLAH